MSSVNTYRTRCTFCSVQDDVILKRRDNNSAVFGGDSLFQLYYDKKNNRGLCPRGNFTVEILESPYRLREAKLYGKTCSVDEAIKGAVPEIKRITKKKNNIAVLISGNHTMEEAYLAKKLAGELNTNFLGLFPFEDEALLSVKNDFSFDGLGEADLVMTVGDIFSLSPTLARPILNARNRERCNSLLSLDIIENRLTPFSEFFKINPGFTAYFLKVLKEYLESDKNNKIDEEKIGLSEEKVKKIAEALRDSKNGQILFSNIYGHFVNPYEIVRRLSEISDITENKFAVIPIGQNSLSVGRIIGGFNNVDIINALKEKKIEGLVVLGGNPFEFIPEFEDIFGYLNFVLSTSFFKNSGSTECLIPSVFSFEKKGSLVSLEEKIVSLGEPVPTVGDCVSDANFVTDLLKEITGTKPRAEVTSPEPITFTEGKEVKPPSSVTSKKFPFILVGIGEPFHHGAGEITRKMKWNEKNKEPCIFMNGSKIEALSLQDEVTVETTRGSYVFKIRDCDDVPFSIPEDVIVIPVHCPESRAIFSFGADDYGVVSPGVEKARIKK